MKFVIVGLHASGKEEILQSLSDEGLQVGHLFTNAVYSQDIYDCDKYELYSNSDINTIFENGAYIFLKGMSDMGYKWYEGLSKAEFEKCDVFAISPSQFLSIPLTNVDEEIVWIWVDGSRMTRSRRYMIEKRTYDFQKTEDEQTEGIQQFVKDLYNFPNSHILYFNDEDPQRVSAIIAMIYKHNDLLDLCIKKFA